MSSNPLISISKASDSGLRASLHPLVLLTISDYITRHTLRKRTQPIVGALLGQQNGRDISIELAYDVKLVSPDDSPQQEWKLDECFFADRLQQYKEVHKAPALELVGWWTVSPVSGPGSEVMRIHQHVLQTYNETALLVAFHSEAALQNAQVGGKLPLTIYESVYESSRSVGVEDDAMQVEGEGDKLELRFRELGYDIATGEAEMIGVDSIASGGGSATAVDSGKQETREAKTEQPEEAERVEKPKSKAKAKEKDVIKSTEMQYLNSEEEELLSFLNTRANAIKMLQGRIALLKKYLQSLPPSYLTSPEVPVEKSTPSDDQVAVSHPILRSILAMTARLPLLVPADAEGFERERQAEHSDVALVELLGGMGKSMQDARELGHKFGIVELHKKDGRKTVSTAPPAEWQQAITDEFMTAEEAGSGSQWENMML